MSHMFIPNQKIIILTSTKTSAQQTPAERIIINHKKERIVPRWPSIVPKRPPISFTGLPFVSRPRLQDACFGWWNRSGLRVFGHRSLWSWKTVVGKLDDSWNIQTWSRESCKVLLPFTRSHEKAFKRGKSSGCHCWWLGVLISQAKPFKRAMQDLVDF